MDKLKEIRKKAEEAVKGMPDGDLKTKAFEIFLNHLLSQQSQMVGEPTVTVAKGPKQSDKISKTPGSTRSRILLLKDEGFFQSPKSLGQVREELHAHGWILPPTTLSGPLQALVRQRELRRLKVKSVKGQLWKYVNP